MSAILELKRRDLPTSVRRAAKGLGIPFSLDLAVLKALSPRPDDRFESASAMRQALIRIARSHKDGSKRSVLKTPFLWASVAALGALGIGGFRESGIDSKADPPAQVVHETEDERLGMVALEGAPVDGTAAGAQPGRILANGAVSADDAPNPAEPVVAGSEDTEEADDALPEALEAAATAEPTAEPNEAAPQQDLELEKELAHARLLMSRGSTGQQRALQLLRKLSEQSPRNPELLELWSKAAAKMKWWGESLRVAIRWAEAEPSETSHLHLARTQRLVGQRYGAIQTLERYLEQEPAAKQVAVVLEQYRASR